MILNRIEFALMNNPVRAAFQRHIEARRFLRMGSAIPGGKALEIGCGRGVGVTVILDFFKAASVDAFDLDPRMIAAVSRRLQARGEAVRLWVGDATKIDGPDNAYDAVFDFGAIHHVPNWRVVLQEAFRVLRPGGRFYAEEPLSPYFYSPLMHRLFSFPTHDLNNPEQFRKALAAAGFANTCETSLWRAFYFFVAAKPAGFCCASDKADKARAVS